MKIIRRNGERRGASISAGEWHQRPDSLWDLTVPDYRDDLARSEARKMELVQECAQLTGERDTARERPAEALATKNQHYENTKFGG